MKKLNENNLDRILTEYNNMNAEDKKRCDEKLNSLLNKGYNIERILSGNLHIPIDITNDGCTADGILKRTAGMDTQTLRKKYPMM